MCDTCINKINEELLILLKQNLIKPNLLVCIAIEDRLKVLAEKMTTVFISDTYTDTNFIESVNMQLANKVIELLDTFSFLNIDINKDLKNDVNFILFEF